jgi:hypothetical protein
MPLLIRHCAIATDGANRNNKIKYIGDNKTDW